MAQNPNQGGGQKAGGGVKRDAEQERVREMGGQTRPNLNDEDLDETELSAGGGTANQTGGNANRSAQGGQSQSQQKQSKQGNQSSQQGGQANQQGGQGRSDRDSSRH